MATLQDYLNPLIQRIEDLEARVHTIEEKLDKILVLLAKSSANSEAAGESAPPAKPPPALRDGSYDYRPLEESKSEIRIIVLHSSPNEQDPINCELLHASLDHNPLEAPMDDVSVAVENFNTLSYTWGGLDKNGLVHIDGYRFPVTANLEAAMRRLRNLKTTAGVNTPTRSFWWIDAICINQGDVLERNWQVNLMTRIYKKAAGMQVWLGEEANDSDLAMDIARQVGDTSPRGPGERDLTYPKVSAELREKHWKALVALCERSWWERVWVRQEVALAKDAVVHCGRQACTFGALTTTLDVINKVVEQLGFTPILRTMQSTGGVTKLSCFTRALELTDFRIAMGQRPNISYRDLIDLIPQSRMCKATDPRDKVFSLLGLVDTAYWQLKADYRLSVTDTFQAAAEAFITKKQSLDILGACQNPERNNGLPSWVPNLVEEWKARPFYRQTHWEEVAAGQDLDFIFEDHKILKARGRLIDHIGVLCDDIVHARATEEELDILSSSWREFAFSALSNKDIYILDKASIQQYSKDDRWIKFLSAGKHRTGVQSHAAAPVKTRGNYRMVESMLLPQEDEAEAVKIDGARNKIHEYLRKSGVGRRLCITRRGKNKGTVAIAPADSQTDDEVWMFRGTSLPYALRRLEDGNYVVVGEVYSDRYTYGYLKGYREPEMEVISIV